MAERMGESMTGDHANARAHHLHGCHERPRQKGSPQHGRAELRAGDRVRCDARRIIVRGSGDDAWTESAEELARR